MRIRDLTPGSVTITVTVRQVITGQLPLSDDRTEKLPHEVAKAYHRIKRTHHDAQLVRLEASAEDEPQPLSMRGPTNIILKLVADTGECSRLHRIHTADGSDVDSMEAREALPVAHEVRNTADALVTRLTRVIREESDGAAFGGAVSK